MEIKVLTYHDFVEVVFEDSTGILRKGPMDLIEASHFLEQLKDAVEELYSVVYDD